MGINDFRRQQFVLIDGAIALSDVDDVSFQEPVCDKHSDCTHYFSTANYTLRSVCDKHSGQFVINTQTAHTTSLRLITHSGQFVINTQTAHTTSLLLIIHSDQFETGKVTSPFSIPLLISPSGKQKKIYSKIYLHLKSIFVV